MFPSFTEKACARNAKPGNVSELLSSYTILFVLACLYGNIKKRLKTHFSAPSSPTGYFENSEAVSRSFTWLICADKLL